MASTAEASLLASHQKKKKKKWKKLPTMQHLTTLRPGEICTHWSTGSPLVQVMACRRFSGKPLPESMMTWCKLNTHSHILMTFQSKHIIFHPRKLICKYPQQNLGKKLQNFVPKVLISTRSSHGQPAMIRDPISWPPRLKPIIRSCRAQPTGFNQDF